LETEDRSPVSSFTDAITSTVHTEVRGTKLAASKDGLQRDPAALG
jgi:hypothetical protein